MSINIKLGKLATITLSLISTFLLATTNADAAVYSLGDSLSDSGALGFTYTNPLDASAYSPGNVWTQYLTNSVPAFCNDPKHCLFDKDTYYYTSTGNNYAVGGAGVTFDSTDILDSTGNIVKSYTSLHYQIRALLNNHKLTKNDVVTVWMGANDILAAAADPANAAVLVSGAAKIFNAEVNRLAKLGARIYVITIPDLSLTPLGQNIPVADSAALHDLTGLFDSEISVLANVRNVTLIDSNAFYSVLLASPKFDNTATYCPAIIDPQHVCGDPVNNPDTPPTSNIPFLFADPIHPSNAAHKWIGLAMRRLVYK